MVMAQWGQNRAAGAAAGAVGAGLATELAPMKAEIDLRVRAEWEESEQLVKYPVAIKVEGGRIEVARPIGGETEADGAGVRGVWYYDPDDVDIMVYLYQNNAHRWTRLKSCYLAADMCHKIFYAASEVWQKGGSVEDVITQLSTISYKKEREETGA
jgi:hypothetical protein